MKIITVLFLLTSAVSSKVVPVLVKRQASTSFQLMIGVGPNKETYLATSGGTRVVALTGASTGTVCIPSTGSLQFTPGLVTVRNFGTQTIPAKAYMQLVGAQLINFSASPSPVVMNVEGCLYYDDCTAFFSASALLNTLISSSRALFPLPQVRVSVTRQGSTLQLNVDESQNGTDSRDNDVTNLRGAETFELTSGESVVYNNNTVSFFQGSMLVRDVGDVHEIHLLENEEGLGGQGIVTMTFMGGASSVIAGPGSIYIGFNSANERIICFIKAPNVSELIGTTLVQMQIITQPTGVLEDAFTRQQLINLSRSQEFSYETASLLEYKNGIIHVYSRIGSLLRAFGSRSMPITLSTFFNNRVDIPGPSQCRNYSVPTGGLSLFYNAQSNTMFAYPATNRFIAAGIQSAIASNTTSATLDPMLEVNNVGEATLVLLDESIIQPTNTISITAPPNSVVNVSPSRISVASTDTLLAQTFMRGGKTTAVTGPRAKNVFTPREGQSVLLLKGGSIIMDVNNDVLIASQSSKLPEFISRSVQEIPPLRVRAASTVINGQPQVSISAAGISLFNATNPDIMETPRNQRIVYLNGSVNAATATVVPPTARVMYRASGPEVVIRDSMNNVLFSQNSLGGPFLTPAFTATTARIEPVTRDSTFQGGGVYYVGNAGGAYLPSDFVNSESFEALNQVRALENCIENILKVSVLDEGRLRRFSSGAFVSLPGDGTSFIVGDQMFHTTDRALVDDVRAANSQVIPLQLELDENGDIVISRRKVILYSFDVTSSTFDLGDEDVVLFSSNTLTGPTTFGNEFAPITVVVTYDGIQNDTLDSMETVTGSGLLVVDEMAQSAFFTSDRLSMVQIKNFLANVRVGLVAPHIEDVRPVTFTSIMSVVNASFGQIVTVPMGSTVNLKCVASIANPPASFSFFQRDSSSSNNGSDFMAIVAGMPGVSIESNGPNERTLQLARVAARETEYRCDAINSLGTATAFARVIAVPGRAPDIQNDYFTSGAGPGTAVVTARSDTTPTVRPIIDDSNVDDRTQISSRVLIGCRAKGRSVPVITWSAMSGSTLNFSLPSVNVSFPGPGQSILSVALELNNVDCVTYMCTATNGLGMEDATARVCPQQFARQGSGGTSNCSVDCGVGIEQVFFDYLRTYDGGLQEMLTANQLPVGLVKINSRICVSSLCPEVIFRFETSNFTICSKFCETGSQSRNVTCVREVGDEVSEVDEEECWSKGILKPASMRRCNTFPCPEYVTTPFGPCSRTCRGGVTARNVTCEMVEVSEDGRFDLGNLTEVAIEVCRNYSRQEEPAEVMGCNENIVCPVMFLASEFGPCDSFNCQERSFTCVRIDSFPFPPTDESVCLDQGLVPVQPVRSCRGRQCNFGRWNVTALGSCSAECGSGLQSFSVVCLNRTNDQVIVNGFCNGNIRPRDTDSCFVRNCPGECLQEPSSCSIIARFRACKRLDIFPVIRGCCKSCPLQATPVPLLD